MEVADSILDAIHEEVSLEDGEDDVEMMDVEEGEVVDGPVSAKPCQGNENEVETGDNAPRVKNVNKRKKKKNKKKKNKNNQGNPGSSGVNIDRFVLDTCKRLRERKSYLVYTAVGVLGVSALSDLVKEVDAVQACGGQMTVDGHRPRTGGGILWNILKVRDPSAFKEIMKKGKEFEKQFRRPAATQASTKSNNPSQSEADAVASKASSTISDNEFETENLEKEQLMQPITEERRGPVRDRIRIPVSYDDILGEEPPKDQCKGDNAS